MNAFWLPVFTLIRREMLRFWRERSRVAGFVGSPLLFWFLIGSGFGNLEFYFPGALTLTVMMSAVFSMMSLIEDRREGFLLAMLVSPAPRAAMVLGKLLGSSLLAWAQGLIFLAFAPLIRLESSPAALLAAAGVLFLVSFTFTALGFLIAWQMNSTQGFHAVMNLVLFPLWMVSGALFSAESAHGWMRWLMAANPMTYALAALRSILDPQAAAGAPGLAASVAVTAVCGLLLLVASARAASARVLICAALLALVSCGRPQPPLEIYGSAPEFRLVAQTNQEFGSKELSGKVWVVDFIFSNCNGPCPRMGAQMRMVQNATADLPDLHLVSITVDPKRDTADVLAAYSRRYQADPRRWHFLTGGHDTIQALSREGFKLGEASESHSTRFVLVDGRGRIRGYYSTENGNGGVKQLIKDARRLVEEERS